MLKRLMIVLVALVVLLGVSGAWYHAYGAVVKAQSSYLNQRELLMAQINQAVADGVPPAQLATLEEQAQARAQSPGAMPQLLISPAVAYYQQHASKLDSLLSSISRIEASDVASNRSSAQQQLTQLNQAISQAKQQGVTVSVYQGEAAAFGQRLAAARVPKDFQGISTAMRASEQALLVASARYQLGETLTGLKTAIDSAQYAGADVATFQAALANYQHDQLTSLDTRQLAADNKAAQNEEGPVQLAGAVASVQTEIANVNNLIGQAQNVAVAVGSFQVDVQAATGAARQNPTMVSMQGAYNTLANDASSLQYDIQQATAQILANNAVSAQQNSTLDLLHREITVATMLGINVSGVASKVAGLEVALQHTPTSASVLSGLQSEQDAMQTVMAAQFPARMVVVSLAEQSEWMYQNGQVVDFTYVTTGMPQLPTVTGVFHIYDKQTPFTFHSPWPPGSPYWYPVTTISYWMPFYEGYGLHDAYWRSTFGPGTDLHGDPGFPEGSHGCVNQPFVAAQFLWNWTSIGTPVVIF